MSRKRIGFLVAAVGVVVLLSSWGRVADWTEAVLRGEEQVRSKKVVYWTTSGSPEVNLKRARQFEQMYPDINVEPNFRETGGIQDILFVSFLSGNPPDFMGNTKVNELRKYILMGGVRPLDDLMRREDAFLRNQYLKRGLKAYREVREYEPGELIQTDVLRRENPNLEAELLGHRLREWTESFRERQGRAPTEAETDDARARLARALAAETQDLYFRQHLMGEARLFRFKLNPEDAYLQNLEANPLEAARLLHMNGKAVAFRDIAMPRILTYNKRLFREAATMFPEAGLVDGHGDPVPPSTWLEFYRTARLLSEYGRRAAVDRGLAEPICYGLTMQGQRDRDLMRGIWPLARRAGSMQFEYRGDTERVARHFDRETEAGREAARAFGDRPIGYFDYEDDAYLAAFALLYKLRQDGYVLPGVESRHYEDVRTALASGQAGMLLDGWHAALIGAERVPWAAQDLGSAPVPLPYHDVDPDAGWPAEAVAKEKEELSELLSLDEAGVTLPPGNKLPQSAADNVTLFTSLCRDPDAAWEWNHFANRNIEVMKTETRRGTVRMEREAVAHIGDPEWFPYPYQEQVYGIIEHHCAMWPERPLHGPVEVPNEREIFYRWFYQTDTNDLGLILTRAREQLQTFSDAANADLARRIRDGLVRPENWTFPDFEPQRAEAFFARQQNPEVDPDAEARLGEARAKLIAWARAHPEAGLLNEAGTDIREDIWQWKASTSPWQLLWIPGLMAGVVLGWFAWTGLRHAFGRKPTEGRLLGRARRGWWGYVFALPGMLVVFAFAIYPSLYQFFLALHTGDGLGPMRYVGLGNFHRIFTRDMTFWTTVLPNTAVFMVLVAVGQIVLGLLFASLLNLPLKANRLYRLLYFIPLVTSLAIVSVILIGLLKGEASALNALLTSLSWWHLALAALALVALGLVLTLLFTLWLRPQGSAASRVAQGVVLLVLLAVTGLGLHALLAGNSQIAAWLGLARPLGNLAFWLGLADEPGKQVDWLGQDVGLYTIAGVAIWHGLAMRIILLLAGLQSINPELYEAAKVDGAGPWSRFWRVTLPEIMPILIIIAFMAFIAAARAFSPVYVLTEGGINHSSEVVATYIFKKGFTKPEGTEPDLGYASALGIVYSGMLAVLTLANVIIIVRRWKRRLQMERQAGGPATERAKA